MCMPNTKQAKKMVRKIKRRTQYNKWWKARIKTAIKTLDQIVAQANVENSEVKEHYSKLQKTIDKAAKNKVIHKNKANRIKSKVSKKFST